MKPNVLIIAAPFGFGPAVKSLIVAEGIKDAADLSFLCDGDAYRFIEKYKPVASSCVKGIFSRMFPVAEGLEQFDFFICINQAPAFDHLGKLGQAGRTVFVDCLLRWRSEIAGEKPKGGLAYLVEDYPGTAQYLDGITARRVALTAPLIWPCRDDFPPDKRQGIVLHLGGVTSPLAPWEVMASAIETLAAQTAEIARRYDASLTIIGSAHLKRLPPLGGGVTILGDVSPEDASNMIGKSALLVTTPGIGAVYEAMTQDTPIILLPPMNSTQLEHYGVFTRHGVAGVLKPDHARQIDRVAKTIAWGQQTRFCLKLWTEKPVSLFTLMPQIAGLLLDEAAAPDARDRFLSGQRKIVAGFSRVSAIGIIRELLAQTPRK